MLAIRLTQDMEDYYIAEERVNNPSRKWSLEDVLNEKDKESVSSVELLL